MDALIYPYAHKFCNELSQLNWDHVINYDDVNKSFDQFAHLFGLYYDKHFPLISKNAKVTLNSIIQLTPGLHMPF